MMAVSLLLVLLITRALGSAGHQLTLSWWAPIAYLWHDAIVVLGFAAIEYLIRERRRLVWCLYVVAALYPVLTIPVQRVLWSPLTPAMWRAAGGPLADSVGHYVTWSNLMLVAVGLASIVLAPALARRLPGRGVVATLLACVVAGPIAAARVDTHGAERNAWTAFASGLPIDPSARVEARDWRASEVAARADVDLLALRGAAAGRNVIVVSLESTAARYLGIYGASPDVAPNLSALASSAVVFDNAYAVYPESIKGLFSVLCSVSPAFDTSAEQYAKVPCSSIAQSLATRGYQSALFHSGRFDYLGMNAIIRNRGFDLLADAGEIGGRHDSSFGIDEPSTVARMLRWVDERDVRRPFFIAYLPIAGHHPYGGPERGPFPDEDEFGRYRNALHYGDAALGELRRGLAARGLDRDTLWIIVGDHGEAFGQHEGNYGHTFELYDENVRVPFLIAAPGRISGPLHARRIVSLIDTAPTVLDVLGASIPASYEGRSMLDGTPRKALFFTDYSLPLVGLRDGPHKVIHDLRSGRTRWFDVEQDRGEVADLAGRHPEQARRYAKTLEEWAAARRQALAPFVR